MEYIPGNDKYLDPPDYPSHSECDGCGIVFDNDDMSEMDNGDWLCEECEEQYYNRIKEEEEE